MAKKTDVFIVDPDRRTREELKIAVRSCGYTVRSFSDGKLALKAIKDYPPRLLVVELLLPQMDGFQLCQTVRYDLGLLDLPILCISGISWGRMNIPEILENRFKARFISKGCLTNDFVSMLSVLAEPPPGSPTPQEAIKLISETPEITSDRLGEMDVLKIEKLKKEYEQEIPSPPKLEFRRVVRIQKEYRIQFQSFKELITEYTKNISSGGVFIKTAKIPEIDDLIEAHMEVPHLSKAIKVKGRVVHCVTKKQASENDCDSGFGIEFIEISDNDRVLLDTLIRDLLDFENQEKITKKVEESPLPVKRSYNLTWVVFVGLPRTPILSRPSFLKRNNIHLLEFPDFESSQSFIKSHQISLVILGENALSQNVVESMLVKLSKISGDHCEIIVIPHQQFQFLKYQEKGLFSELWNPKITTEEILEKISNKIGVKKRTSVRIPYRSRVKITLLEAKFAANIIDIGCGGMLISTHSNLSIGSTLHLSFDLERHGVVESDAVVVRNQPETGTNHYLLGLAFSKLSHEDEKKLREFVESRINFREFFEWAKARCFANA